MGDDAQALTLTTADGIRLRAVLEVPDGPVDATAVVAHPHPLYGGDQDNPVVTTVARTLRSLGVATIRFGFRGSGGSGGSHGGGPAERLDVLAAAAELTARYPDLPLLLAGYSFGADVSLTVDAPGVVGWLAVAPPLALFPADELVAGPDPRPVVLLVPEHDQYDPPAEAAARTAGWTATSIHPVPMADHFLMGAGTRLADLVRTHTPSFWRPSPT
ncbi:MAG: hypothetical protein MUE34_04255 [Acidimicrobiales bacterium]|jgi:alpha/beta superfamily hydrolase|nr:hypothetical protein [Acidimicrobiales bacterium]